MLNLSSGLRVACFHASPACRTCRSAPGRRRCKPGLLRALPDRGRGPAPLGRPCGPQHPLHSPVRASTRRRGGGSALPPDPAGGGAAWQRRPRPNPCGGVRNHPAIARKDPGNAATCRCGASAGLRGPRSPAVHPGWMPEHAAVEPDLTWSHAAHATAGLIRRYPGMELAPTYRVLRHQRHAAASLDLAMRTTSPASLALLIDTAVESHRQTCEARHETYATKTERR